MKEAEAEADDGTRPATADEMATLITTVLLRRIRPWRFLEEDKLPSAVSECDDPDMNIGTGIVVTEIDVNEVRVDSSTSLPADQSTEQAAYAESPDGNETLRGN